MRRREFITLLGGAAVIWPLEARSQREVQTRRIGWLGGSLIANDPESQARKAAFLQGLRELGRPTDKMYRSITAGVQAAPTSFANTQPN